MAIVVGLLLCGIGILHAVVNIRWLHRVAARGDVAERFVPQLAANIAFAGMAIAMPGIVLLLVAPALGRGKRMAARLALASGLFYVVAGIAGYLWQPIPRVLIFTALGACVCAPLVIWRRDFTAD